MEMNEYQGLAVGTAIYPGQGEDLGLFYAALGLANEAGEVAGKVKKRIRDGNFDTKEAAKELGDVLWYVAVLADELGYNLDSVAAMNVAKLKSRFDRGTIGGSGDNR